MKKKINDRKKMSLAKETLATMDAKVLGGVGGGGICQESHVICSIQHTCVSCPVTETCA
jgi:hypothetical protein